ncbi:Transcription regulatory protein SNF2 [Cyberlindnera fabianii]|nr:Transcription regulatory protein SNF2 [Cyberlindnera fabianii]
MPTPSMGQQQIPGQQRGQINSGLFAPYQSILLKAQIAAFKCLVKNMPIPPEVNNILMTSVKNNANANLGNVTGPSGTTVTHPPNTGLPNATPRSISASQTPLQVPGQQIPASVPQSMNANTPQLNPHMSPQASVIQSTSNAASPIVNQSTHGSQHQTPVIPGKATSATPTSQQLPPAKPGPNAEVDKPVPIEKFKELHPDITTIVPINDPKLQVESYTMPKQQSGVPYEILSHPKSRVIVPGVFPPGLDLPRAADLREATIQLEIDATLEEFSFKLQGIEDPENKDLDDLIDYYALKLLPLQKAMRGHVASFNYFKNSLLTNTHPNFLAKIRKINLMDASTTTHLHTQQLNMKQKIEHKKKFDQIEKLTADSGSIIKKRTAKKELVVKFGRSISSAHVNIEKEEQKRIERNAKQRLQALKANDEEAYIKLLDQTKDTRITHLLKQTNTFLDSLAQAVKEQQKETHEAAKAVGREVNDEFENIEEGENIDYYSVAHRIKEEVKVQPSILVGGELKEYQMKGLQWMVSLFNNHLNGILADEMGLGKTIQSISLITYLVEVKKVPGPFLVIVPLSTLTNWNLEFEKWAPSVKKITYKGNPNARKTMQHDIRTGNFQVLLTTFEYIIKDRPLLSKISWAHMIIDEGHRMKNSNSKLSSTLTQFYHTDYRLILTGTPLQNNLPELWALLNFVLPKIFNSVKSFDEWFNTPFANTGGQDKIELSEEETLLVIRRLHKVLRPFLLRRLKKDVEKDLPDKVEKVIKCKMSSLQRSLYQQMLKCHQIFTCDESGENFVPVKGLNNPVMQLRKICNHPFVFEDIEDLINPSHETNNNIWRVAGKFELLQRVLPKFKATGHRVLIFFQMTQIMDIMEDFLRLNDLKYLRLDGSTKPDDRTDLLKLFNAPDSEYFAFLLSTRAGGLGLNLQTADTVIIFDTDWNPHQDLQAQDRAHRIGQKNEVRILRLITEDSVEEVILERAHQKLDIDGKVIQAGKFDNKSTAEEQEALLRALLEAEENKKADDNEDLDDDELNEILSRNDDELALFKKMDEENKNKNLQGRLITLGELPKTFSKDPLDYIAAQDVHVELGRGARERKQMYYEDNISEEQWLREIDAEESDDGDAEDAPKRKKKKRSRAKKQSLDQDEDDDDEDQDGFVGKKRRSAPPAADNEFDSGASTPAATPPVGGPRGRGKKAPARGKKSTPASRAQTPANRLPRGESLTRDQRETLNLQCENICEDLIDYINEDGRRLSDIFMVKPAKRLYPDYYVLIKYPIAFDMIKKRIHSKIYQSLREFIEDIHLMFANARIYNEEGSMVYNDANELEKLALEKYLELTEETSVDFTEFDEEHLAKVQPKNNVADGAGVGVL